MINTDKFVKCVKFETALRKLSKLVQKEDGEVFFISDIISHYEQGLKEFENLENTKNIFGEKLYSDYELIQNARHTSTDETMTSVEHIYPDNYYYYWKMQDGSFFRMNIEYHSEIGWYIDCGMKEV
jgi:hypothetical protein